MIPSNIQEMGKVEQDSYAKLRGLLWAGLPNMEISQDDAEVSSSSLKDAYLNFIGKTTLFTLIPLNDAARILLGRSSSLRIMTINRENSKSVSPKSMVVDGLILRSIKSGQLEVVKLHIESRFGSLGRFVKFGDILLWAVHKKIRLAVELREILGIFQPIDGKKEKFNPQKTILQSVAQFVWYHKPITIEAMKEDLLFKAFCPKEGYQNIKTLRDTIKQVDPRPSDARTKPKRSGIPKKLVHLPCRHIPGVLIEEDHKKLIDIRKLVVVCETIRSCQTRSSSVYPKIQIDRIEDHPLVGIYLKHASPLIQSVVSALID